MRRSLLLASALILVCCCAAYASGGGGGSHASAPTPAPTPPPAAAGGSHAGGGSHTGGGSPQVGGGSPRTGGGSPRSGAGGGPRAGTAGGTSHGYAPPSTRGFAAHSQTSTTYRPPIPMVGQRFTGGATGAGQKIYNNYYVCDGGGYFYQSYVPCPEGYYGPQGTGWYGGDIYVLAIFLMEGAGGAAAGAGTGADNPNMVGYENHLLTGTHPVGGAPLAGPMVGVRTVKVVDPGLKGMGLPGSGARGEKAALPVQTRLSDVAASYVVVLRNGTAFASMVPPSLSGNSVVGRDRTGLLFSVRASEVDLDASHIQASKAASPPKH
jgi:hypothetical protein